MKFQNIFWDLDGTLTDSSEGITKCTLLAFEHFGITKYEKADLTSFIGPPLRDSFLKYGLLPEQVEEAVAVFRGRYNTVGKYENTPYPGIADLLEKLRGEGYHHFVATSKPENTAMDVLNKFHLTEYFEEICGANPEGTRDKKEQVISYLLEKIGDTKDVVMVGDTVFDVEGAKHFGIPCICVDWGFGKKEEMLQAGAIGYAHTMEELYTLLTKDHPDMHAAWPSDGGCC